MIAEVIAACDYKRTAIADIASIEFYFTLKNVTAEAECAQRCAKAKFCYSAVFSPKEATCRYSYRERGR